MRLNSLGAYISAVSVTLVAAIPILVLLNWAAQAYLRAKPELLMSAADRINENTRAVREAMIPPERAREWYDLERAEDVRAMWDEYYNAGTVFESFVHFRSKAVEGKFYGVSPSGLFRRVREQGPWPPSPQNFNILFFGGSTAFGVGPYWATIAAYLQDALNRSGTLSKPVRIYNFGRSGYMSAQEQVLFHRLISAGVTADMAIFFDGLNDFCLYDGNPGGWQVLAGFWERTNEEYQVQMAGYGVATPWNKLREFAQATPLVRLFGALARRLAEPPIPTYAATAAIVEKAIEDDALRQVIDRYRRNMRQVQAVAEANGIVPVFVWQPIPTYKYDTQYHVFMPDRLTCHVNSKFGYPLAARMRHDMGLGRSFIWAADIQEDRKQPLYIDAFHYTAPFSRDIAAFIAAELFQRRLLPNG